MDSTGYIASWIGPLGATSPARGDRNRAGGGLNVAAVRAVLGPLPPLPRGMRTLTAAATQASEPYLTYV